MGFAVFDTTEDNMAIKESLSITSRNICVAIIVKIAQTLSLTHIRSHIPDPRPWFLGCHQFFPFIAS